MACGTPVVSSDGGSLPEALGDAALVLRGFDPDAWPDTARRAAMAAAGVAHAARYRWSETARQTWDVYRKAGA